MRAESYVQWQDKDFFFFFFSLVLLFSLFLLLFMASIVFFNTIHRFHILFQLIFTFIYSTFSEMFLVSAK